MKAHEVLNLVGLVIVIAAVYYFVAKPVAGIVQGIGNAAGAANQVGSNAQALFSQSATTYLNTPDYAALNDVQKLAALENATAQTSVLENPVMWPYYIITGKSPFQ